MQRKETLVQHKLCVMVSKDVALPAILLGPRVCCNYSPLMRAG